MKKHPAGSGTLWRFAGQMYYLYVRIPVTSLDSKTQYNLKNGKAVNVIHYLDDGTSTELCKYDYDGEYIIIYCESFSYYVISSEVGGALNNNQVDCMLNGHKYEQRSDIDNHWDECTVCGDVINVEPYSDSKNNRICDVCGRDMKDATAITTELDRIYFYFNDSVNLGPNQPGANSFILRAMKMSPKLIKTAMLPEPVAAAVQ